jgi:outer membrane protein
MKRHFLQLTTLLAFLFGSMAFAETVKVTFDGLKSILEEKNVRLRALKHEVAAAEARQGSFGRSFIPHFELYGSQEIFQTGYLAEKSQPTFGAEAKISLFNGGRDLIESEVRALNYESKIHEHMRVRAEELSKARKLFWELLALQEKLSVLHYMEKVNGDNLRVAEKRIRNGVATESDRFEFEMKGIDIRRDLATVRIELNSGKRELALLLGFDTAAELEFPLALEHSHEFAEQIKHEEKDHDFLLKELEIQGTAIELSAQMQKRAWWPEIIAFAAYNEYNQRIEGAGPEADSRMRNESVLGVRVKINLLEGIAGSREAQALLNEAQAKSLLAAQARREMEGHFVAEVAELHFLHDQVHDAESNIQLAEKYYQLTQSEYSRGVKNSPDVLGASERLFEKKMKRIEIIRDFQISKSHLLSKIGK